MFFDNGVRPIGFETNTDGTTRRMFVQISDFHGFYIVDFASRREIGSVKLPELPKEQQNWDTLQGSPSHGIGVTPDGKTLWVCSKVNHAMYAYSMPDLKLLGGVSVGHHPDWLTFTPDSKFVYVANAGSNSVSVIDVAARKEITQCPGGPGAQAQHHRDDALNLPLVQVAVISRERLRGPAPRTDPRPRHSPTATDPRPTGRPARRPLEPRERLRPACVRPP